METVDHGTPATRRRTRELAREFFETTDFDKLPDLETAKKLTDAADREAEDYDDTDEPDDPARVRKAIAATAGWQGR